MPWFNSRKIVVPIDSGDKAEGAVDVALQIAPEASAVTVIHVAPELNVLEPGIVWGEKI